MTNRQQKRDSSLRDLIWTPTKSEVAWCLNYVSRPLLACFEKKKLTGTQCFAKGQKQIFCTQSLFDTVVKENL